MMQRIDTALIDASENNDSILIKQLLEKKVNIDFQNKKGATALMIASRDGHFSIVKQLISAGCNINLTSNSGFTALTLALYKITLLLSQNY